MEVEKAILTRRSIRKYKKEEISEELITKILESARWAPSGLNNQPWRFVIVRDKKRELARLTKYSYIITGAAACIAVFFDQESGYDRTKDLLALGAAIQNMLLQAHALGLGSCWLGEILNRKEEVAKLLQVEGQHELVGVVALGYPDEKPRSSRKELKELVIGER
jgi:nitroreductase